MKKNPAVDEYLKKKKHPLNDEIQLVREIILSMNRDIQETIKWDSPADKTQLIVINSVHSTPDEPLKTIQKNKY